MYNDTTENACGKTRFETVVGFVLEGIPTTNSRLRAGEDGKMIPMNLRILYFAFSFSLLVIPLTAQSQEYQADLIVYGPNSAGVAAAVQASRMGLSVILVGPDKHLGGLTSGGLGWTDSGRKEVVGGLAREFYQRLKKHYDRPEAWRFQKPEEYSRYRPDEDAMWVFEPHVAEQGFEDWVEESKFPVHRQEWLDREKGVVVRDGRIQSIAMLSGKTYRGKVFIDATYEGDLMAAAGFVRGMMGVSASAWEEAQHVMEPETAAIVLAAMLQRIASISNPGGYLRALSAKAATGSFTPGPMIMALLNDRARRG